jgi:hypothetical protein
MQYGSGPNIQYGTNMPQYGMNMPQYGSQMGSMPATQYGSQMGSMPATQYGSSYSSPLYGGAQSNVGYNLMPATTYSSPMMNSYDQFGKKKRYEF